MTQPADVGQLVTRLAGPLPPWLSAVQRAGRCGCPHSPEWGRAAIGPSVKVLARRAVVLLLRAPPEPNPEIPVRWQEVLDELLHQLLFVFGLDADQLAPIPPARCSGFLKVQSSRSLVKVNDFVTGPLCPAPADQLS